VTKRVLHVRADISAVNPIAGSIRMIKNYIHLSDQAVVEPYILLVCKEKESGEILRNFFQIPAERLLLIANFSNHDLFKITFWKKIICFIKKNRIDIIHSHSYKADFITILLKIFIDKKIISTVHGYNPASNRIKSRIIWFFYKHIWYLFDYTILVSEALLGINTFKRLNQQGKLVVAPNFIPEFSTTRKKTHRNSIFTIICIGRLSYEKNQILLCKAIKEITPHNNIKCLLIGDGSERANIERYIEKAGIQEYVYVCGYKENVITYYQEADLLVIPSLSEGLPLVLLEAMSLKCPIVAANIGQMGKILPDGNGLLFEKNNHEDLAKVISFSMDNEEKLGKMADNAYKYYKEHFSVEAGISVVYSVYGYLGLHEDTR
jgi:L-malate glycosyltransferase